MSDWLKRYERKRFGDNAPPVSDTLTRLEEERKKREAEKSAFYKTEFGVISGNAISALENDRIEQYTPVTEEEKQTIGKYRAYLQEQVERDRKYGTPQSDKKTKFITQGNTVESFASHLAEQSSHGMKQGLKNISNFFADLFAMQMQQTKYDPATMFAEAHGMIDKGYGEVYAGIVDKQTENITENIKEQTEKNIRDKIAISERYPDLGKIPRKVGEYGGSFAEIVPSIGLSFAAPNLGTFAFAANAYGNALSSSLMQGQDIYEARKNAGISFSASLAASKASQGVGKVIDKALVNMGVKQMMNKTLDDILMKGIVLTKDKIFPEIMRGVGTGLSFSAVNLGLNILRTDYKPTKKEVTITLTQGAIFGILNAAVRSVRMSAANRKSFETHYANVTSYLRALDYIGRHGTKAQIETAKANATVAVDNLIDFFMKNRFVGAGEETATMIRGLMVLKDGLLREPHSGILGDGSTPTQGTSVHTANIGKQVATPTTEPQQTETAPVTQRTATPDKVQPVTELGEVMQSLEPVQVGDTFVEKKSGNKITIVEADDNKVKIEIDNGENITSREISQFKAMELQDDERFEPANAQPEPVQEKVEKSAASEEIVAEQEPSLGTDKYIGKEYSDGEKTYKVAEHLLNGKEPVYLFEELKPDGSTKSFGAQIIKPDEIERHIKLLESQKNDYLKRQESKRIAEERRAVKQAQKDEQEKLMNEFLKPLSALEQGRHRKTLSVVKNYGEGYGAVTLREFIEKSVADNKEFKEAKTLKKKYYDIKTPREYIANIGAPREQFDVHKMYKENNLEKIKREHPFLYYKMTGDESVLDDSFYNKEYRVFENENTFIRVPKTAYDYAMFLSNNELTDDGKSGKIGLEREVVNDEKNQAGLHNDIHERREDGDRYSRADRKDGEVGRREAADGSGEGADGQIDSEHNRLRGEKTGGIENEEITYKKLDDAFVKTEEMQEIEIGNSKYGFKTVFISDAQQKIGGVIKNIGGYYHSGKIYLNVGKSKRGLSLNEKNRHELVHAIKAQNPAKYDALSQTFIKNVHVPKLKEALQSYKKKYTLSYGEDGELLLEEFIADVSYNLDNPNTQAVFVDFEKIKKAYEEFFGIDAEQGTRGIKEEVRAEVSDGETKKHENIVSLSKEIENSIADGNKLTFSQIQGMANKEFNGTLANNDYDIQDMYEAMELAFNNWVLNAKPNSATDIIKALDLMPTQTRRSEKKIKYQMFSTPPTLSYLANLAAHIQNNDIVLEPSAGTGSLAVFAIINGADVVVNELDGQRLELLKTLPIKIAFNEDAAHIGNILHDKFKPSIVVMNPPFSSAVTTNMKNTMLTINHIKSAFNMLPVGGRLVTITGQSYAPSENAFKNMVKALKNADFKANISFDGNVYAKYGTTFGTQIIVIDKLARGETTATDNMKTGAYDKNTLAEAENLLKNIERESIKENIFIDEREVKSDEGVDTGRIHGTVPGRSGRNADVRSGRSENTDDGRIQQDTRRGRGQDRSGIQSDGRDGLSGGVREGTVEKGTSPSDGDLRNDNRREIAESQKELVQDTDSFTHYNVPEFGFETGGVKLQKHPTLVVESNALALTPAPDITYKPNLPKWLVSSGGISDVQLEAVARAGQAFEQRLSTGERMGFFLGDGTGTGKGRTIAATILDSVRRGDERAVWFSQNKDLYRDANRDITAVWGDKKTDTTINLFEGGKKADASLSNGNITYMTYSTLQQNYQDADSNLNKLIGSLGEDFNGVIVFDESHNISNVGGEDSGRGRSKASKSAESAQELLARLPNAKALYVSATGIPKAERLPYLSRLGLWGDGTDFATSGELIAAITQNPDAELALMETLSQMLKRKGLYVSRNLSYSGVEYNQLKLPLSDTQKYEYDKFSGIWRKVFKEIFDSAVEATGGKETGNPLVTKLNKGFYGAAQRFFMSLNTIMKMDGIIEDAKKQIADGKQVVIQFYNTNEAGLDRAIQENVLMGNEESIELRPLQILEELIANIYPVQVMEEYVDDNGNKRWRYATDSEGNVIEDKEAIRKRGELLQEIRDLESMPDYRLTAMDKVINAFGKDKVAEVTGRKNYVVVDDKGNPKVAKRNSSTANSKEAAEFNSGKRDVLIFSLPSGGTGFSFHDTNGKQRAFYYAEMGWGAVAATQGEGRVHRAGELSKPIYTMPSNDMPIEKRTMSAITNRLAALGALTKGQRDSTENVNFDIESSTDNIYGRAGLKELYLELLKTKEGRESLANMAMLHRLVKDGEQVSPNDGIWTDTKKFLNTVPLLNYEDGVKITSRYFDIVEQLVERAKENGTFQEKLKRLPAEKVTITREVDNGSGLILREIDIVKKTTRTDYNPNLKTYKRKSDGLLVQARETSTYHDSNGDEVKNYRATQPNGNFEYLNEKSLERRFEILENAKEAWEKELSEIPQTYTIKGVTLSGEILGNYKLLPNDFKVNIVHAEGKAPYIGVAITNEGDVRSLLRKFDIAEETKNLSIKDIMDSVKAGKIVNMGRLAVFQSRVSGENRIEVSGIHPSQAQGYKDKGVFSEIINYKTRYFVPVDKAEKVLNDIKGSYKYSLDEKPDNTEHLFKPQKGEVESFSKQVDEWLKGEMKSDEHFKLGNTPAVLKALGAKKLPLIMTQDVIVKITGRKHSISLDEIKQLPQQIADPIMIFASDTVPGAFVVLTELLDKNGNDLVVAIHLNKKQTHISVNRVASVHPRTAPGKSKNVIGSFVEAQIKRGNLRYVDKNKSDEWLRRGGLQLPSLNTIITSNKIKNSRNAEGYNSPSRQDAVPNNNILHKEDIVNSYYTQNSEKMSLESEDVKNGRGLLLHGDLRRHDGESAGKQVKAVDGGTKEAGVSGKAGETSQDARRVYAKDVKDNGRTEVRRVGNGQVEAIKESAFNDEMRAIDRGNKKRGIKETVFFVGEGKIAFSNKIFKGMIADGIVAIRYDHRTLTPQQINKHEIAHSEYNTDRLQKVKNIIKNSLPVVEKRRIIHEVYKQYLDTYSGNEAKVFEEFVCDVLSGLNSYSVDFDKIVNDYWAGNEIVDYYNPADYAGLIDAGGFVDNVGFGEVRYSFNDGLGWHKGDLGKAESFASQYGGTRGTGHFGTGTYFVGENLKGDFGRYQTGRPIHSVDFSKYNLFTPSSYYGRDLHAALKAINSIYSESYKGIVKYNGAEYNQKFFVEEVLPSILNSGKDKVSDSKIKSAFNNTLNYIKEMHSKPFGVQRKADSASTYFMKQLGFEGVDVRHIKELDDTE
ncbi:MAG: strawberry notch family protein, partial [Firmicutes bacterium]|nr:strawberry notch family protein [Bacillota bacterium]